MKKPICPTCSVELGFPVDKHVKANCPKCGTEMEWSPEAGILWHTKPAPEDVAPELPSTNVFSSDPQAAPSETFDTLFGKVMRPADPVIDVRRVGSDLVVQNRAPDDVFIKRGFERVVLVDLPQWTPLKPGDVLVINGTEHAYASLIAGMPAEEGSRTVPSGAPIEAASQEQAHAPPQEVPDDIRCQDITAKGTRCRNRVRRGATHCSQHGGDSTSNSESRGPEQKAGARSNDAAGVRLRHLVAAATGAGAASILAVSSPENAAITGVTLAVAVGAWRYLALPAFLWVKSALSGDMGMDDFGFSGGHGPVSRAFFAFIAMLQIGLWSYAGYSYGVVHVLDFDRRIVPGVPHVVLSTLGIGVWGRIDAESITDAEAAAQGLAAQGDAEAARDTLAAGAFRAVLLDDLDAVERLLAQSRALESGEGR